VCERLKTEDRRETREGIESAVVSASECNCESECKCRFERKECKSETLVFVGCIGLS
jgi:hypothetical protein